jgi:hypothetical protein
MAKSLRGNRRGIAPCDVMSGDVGSGVYNQVVKLTYRIAVAATGTHPLRQLRAATSPPATSPLYAPDELLVRLLYRLSSLNPTSA